MTEPPLAQVECYSGYTYAQEPKAVVWLGRRALVSHVDERWRTPEGPAFRVRTKPGDRFELRYDEIVGQWTVQVLPANNQAE